MMIFKFLNIYFELELDMQKQVIELEKNGFKYFKILIKNKIQPLFIRSNGFLLLSSLNQLYLKYNRNNINRCI